MGASLQRDDSIRTHAVRLSRACKTRHPSTTALHGRPHLRPAALWLLKQLQLHTHPPPLHPVE